MSTLEGIALIDTEHGGTVVAALAHYAVHVADPSACYAALRATNPSADWDSWVTSCERLRADMRSLQGAPTQTDDTNGGKTK